MTRQILDKQSWTTLRISLNNSYENPADWSSVIKLFNQRIRDFYFTPINNILKPNNRKGEGFSILTLQCALIEMLAAFRQGKIHNRSKSKNGFKYEYKDSSSCFIDFLKTEKIFRKHFYITDKKTGIEKLNPNYTANEFYGKVRCGLMHEARTKENWLITAGDDTVSSTKMFITYNPITNTKSVNRTTLQIILEKYFNDVYLKDLVRKDTEGNKFRRLFARKLDHLFDIPRDMSFDWWKDK
jgi:hypothetical protein